jgi:hypothetical protein
MTLISTFTENTAKNDMLLSVVFLTISYLKEFVFKIRVQLYQIQTFGSSI